MVGRRIRAVARAVCIDSDCEVACTQLFAELLLELGALKDPDIQIPEIVQGCSDICRTKHCEWLIPRLINEVKRSATRGFDLLRDTNLIFTSDPSVEA